MRKVFEFVVISAVKRAYKYMGHTFGIILILPNKIKEHFQPAVRKVIFRKF